MVVPWKISHKLTFRHISFFSEFAKNVPRVAKYLMNLDESSIQVLDYKTENRYWNEVTNTITQAQMK